MIVCLLVDEKEGERWIEKKLMEENELILTVVLEEALQLMQLSGELFY